MKLSEKQKRFLFDQGYITAKCLDACTDEPDWREYFIKKFDWIYREDDSAHWAIVDLVKRNCPSVKYGLYLNLWNDKPVFLALK